MKRNVPHN